MKEEFLQFIWQYRLFDTLNLTTGDGKKIEIIHPGTRNSHAGPDFFNAKIRIDRTLWAGNVEIHVHSGDWQKHKHHLDEAYDNVILHVVYQDDQEVFHSNGEKVLTMVIRFPEKLLTNYQKLLSNRMWIPCEHEIHKVDFFKKLHWTGKLSIERIERKTHDILTDLKQNRQHWEETFYHTLAKYFGQKINAYPFYQLARSLPVHFLAKHKNHLFQVEALLFGQSGLLNGTNDEYAEKLKKEYAFLQKKFALKPIDAYLWKFLRLRPPNFPTLRIAQFASLVHRSSFLFSKIMETEDMNDFIKLFEIRTSDYWKTHYHFGKISNFREKRLGEQSIHILLINVVVPFLFLYGQTKGNERHKEKAIEILEKLSPEKNSIITHWQKLGINASNAFYSQGLLQLKNEYCKFKRCLQCEIGNQIIRENIYERLQS